MTVVPFTIYDLATGEILISGDCVEGGKTAPDGAGVHYGAALSPASHIFVDGVPSPRSAPAPVSQDELRIRINRERDRRIEAGRAFNGVHITGSARDQINLLALKDTARDLKAAGVTAAIIPFRDGQDVEHVLTADDVIELADAGKAYVTALYLASWSLKAMDPMPQNVVEDSLWPSSSS